MIGFSKEEIFKREADYILSLQKTSGDAKGAVNDIPPILNDWNWIVPRENGMSIYAFVLASEVLKDEKYLEAAKDCANYLAKIQNKDGSWSNQYRNTKPFWDTAKSPTQAAEVMMAYDRLGYKTDQIRSSIIAGAEFLLSLQNEKGLISGGFDKNNKLQTWCWITDNCYAYKALIAVSKWTDGSESEKYKNAANLILNGINKYFYISEIGIWHVVIDENGIPQSDTHAYKSSAWLHYAPQMLDLTDAVGYGDKRIGEWIHSHLQDSETGAVKRGFDYDTEFEFQPGLAFQAAITWNSLGQFDYAKKALDWAYNSGLYYSKGGWVDWYRSDKNKTAGKRERFPDTSFYHIAALTKDFSF